MTTPIDSHSPRLALGAVQVGDELPALSVPEISRTTLALFAGASGDVNPVHIDSDVANSAGFDDVFAHGMLSMAYLGRLLTRWIAQERILEYSVRFAAITPVHSRPTCTAVVTAIDGDIVTLDLRVALADGTVTLTGTSRVHLD